MVTSIQKALNHTHEILEKLLDSSLLDLSTEAKDCLEVFDQYEWVMIPGCDAAVFQQLKDKGDAGTMSSKELNQFMEMVSRDGEHHLYLTIFEGRMAIEKYRELCIRDENSTPSEEFTGMDITN